MFTSRSVPVSPGHVAGAEIAAPDLPAVRPRLRPPVAGEGRFHAGDVLPQVTPLQALASGRSTHGEGGQIASHASFRRLSCLPGVELIQGQAVGPCFPIHTHDEYSLVAIESGHARFLCGRGVCDARPGCLILIEPGVPHTGGSADDKPVGYRTMQVPPGAFELAARGERPRFPVQVVTDPVLAAAFTAVHRRLLEAPDSACNDLLALLDDIVRRHGAAGAGSGDTREPRRIRVVREHLAANLAQTASLDALSDLVGVSPFYLQRTFKAATRMSPREYQMDLRIRRARQLLREGMPPRAVAGAVGFFDQSHFTRAFRKLTGVTPGQYAARPGRDGDPVRRPGAA